MNVINLADWFESTGKLKKMMSQLSRFMILRVLFISTLLAPIFGSASEYTKACSNDPNALKVHVGMYVDSNLIADVLKSRKWNIKSSGVNAISIDTAGKVTFNYAWHEGTVLERDRPTECFVFYGESLIVQNAELGKLRFERMSIGSDLDVDGPLFNLLFKGCYSDLDKVRWCFSTQKITIGNKVLKANLVLDRTEMPEDGSPLRIQGESLFWIFKPDKDGWLVLKSDWASSEKYRDLDWVKPWAVLKPE